MGRRIVGTIVGLLLLVLTFGTAISIQRRALKQVSLNPPFMETWQLRGRSGEVLRTLALRYDLVMADFLWLRAIQSFGGRGMSNRDWRPLYNMFDTITELDPYFEEAYTFGNMVIGDEGGQQREALGLINKGMFKMLEYYRIPFEGMYVAHWTLQDLPLARWYGRMALKRKNAPDWVPRIVAYLDVQSGAYYVGLDRFIGNLMQALDAKDPVLEGIALGKIKETIEKWNLDILTKALDQYTSSTGRLPATIEDLATQPALQNYEVAKMSRVIAAGDYLIRNSGREGFYPHNLQNTALPQPDELSEVEANPPTEPGAKSMMVLQNKVFRHSLVKQSGIPQDPFGGRYIFNRAVLGNRNAEVGSPITNELQATEFLQQLLLEIRSHISRRKEELGRNPNDLREVFQTDFNTTEPFGGKWLYDAGSGTLKSSSKPTL